MSDEEVKSAEPGWDADLASRLMPSVIQNIPRTVVRRAIVEEYRLSEYYDSKIIEMYVDDFMNGAGQLVWWPKVVW